MLTDGALALKPAIERPGIWLPSRRRHLRLVPPIEIVNGVAFVNNVGTGVSTVSGNTVTLVPAQNCVAGNLLVIGVNSGNLAVSSVTDTKSNTWVIDKTQGASSVTTCCSTLQNGGALTTGDTITVNFSTSGANKVCCAMEFSGVRSGTRVDVTPAAATGTTATAVSSGATATNTFGDDVVIGCIGWVGAAQRTLTKGASYTALLEKDESAGTFLGVALEYKIQTVAATQTADGTLSAAPTAWNAICLSYMGLAAAASGAPRPVVSAPSIPVRNSFQVGARF